MKKKSRIYQLLKDFAGGIVITVVWALSMCVILWPLVQLVNWIM